MNEKRKNARLWNGLLIALFCAFLGGMGALYLFLPKQAFSEREKRVLPALPAPTLRTLTDGSWEARFETWMSDHAPGREGWVSLNAHYELASGRNGLYAGVLRGRSGRLYAAPAALDAEAVTRRCERIARFAGETGLPTAVLLIPESGAMNPDDLPVPHAAYRDGEALSLIADALDGVPLIDFAAACSGADPRPLYYRTDHHYTARGAYLAFCAYLEALGRTPPAEEEFSVEEYPGFLGSMYARAGLWEVPAESVGLWKHPLQEGVRVTFDDREGAADSLFFPEHLAELDKYPVFLDGNHALADIDSGRTEGETLLIVRDSFGHCFAPFAETAFRRVVLVDLRYYHQSVAELARAVDADRVLFLYGMDTFLTDANFAWLR